MLTKISHPKNLGRHLRLVKSNDQGELASSFIGIITPISWDKNDIPREFSLFLDNHEELILKPIDNKCLAFPYINKRVTVIGTKGLEDTLHYSNIVPHLDSPQAKAKTQPEEFFGDDYNLFISGAIKWEILH